MWFIVSEIMKIKRVTSGVFIAVAGVLMFSAKAVLVKLCYQYELSDGLPMDEVTILMLRMGFAFPFFIGVGLFKTSKEQGSIKLQFHHVWKIVILGVLGYYGASYFDFLGLKTIDASLERLILFVYPTVTVLLSAVFLKKPITMRQVLAILITYVGILIVFMPSVLNNVQTVDVFGVCMVVCSGVAYATYLVASQHFVGIIGTVRFTTAAMLVSCVSVAIHYCFDSRSNIWGLDYHVYVYAFLMAVFSTVIPSYMISEAIKRIGAGKVSIIGSLGPISTIFLSVLLLGEQISIWFVLGGAVVIGGVVWLNLQKAKS